MDCIFCKIINKEIFSYSIYEDKIINVILYNNPNSNGHILIVTKKHYENIKDIDLEIMNHINVIIKKMYKHILEKLNPDGITIVQNNGFGQDIKHYHMHLIPKYKEKQELLDLKDIYELLK